MSSAQIIINETIRIQDKKAQFSMSERVQKNSEDYKDVRIIWFVMAYFVFQAINLYIKTMEIPSAIWEQFSKGILAVFLSIALYFIFKKEKLLSFFCIEIAFVLFSIYSMSFSSNNLSEDFQSIMFNNLFVYIPLGVCIYEINNYNLLLKKLYVVSWPIGVILGFLFFSIKIDEHNYYMTLGYSLLFPLLIVFDHFRQTKRIVDLFYVVFSTIMIFIAGSRGPLVCLLFYILTPTLFKKEKININSLILLISIGIIYIYFNSIVLRITDILSTFDIRSRTLEFFLESNYDDSGRLELYSFFLNQIYKRPVFGWGIASGWYLGLYYPHNILIDFIVSFGIPLGCLCSVALFYLVFVGIKAKDESKRRLFIILCSISLSLLYTGTFIKNQTFFMFLAIGIKIIYDLHNQTDIEVENNDEEV